MHTFHLPRRLAQIAAAGLLTFAVSAAAYADQHSVPTPVGWMMMPLPSIRGHIQAADTDDAVQLMYNDEQKLAGAVMVTFTPDGGYAGVLKTFKYEDSDANPPRLSMIEPGDYLPACHPGTPCEKVHIAQQAVGLCFGEASCRILYYEDKQLHDIVMTD